MENVKDLVNRNKILVKRRERILSLLKETDIQINQSSEQIRKIVIGEINKEGVEIEHRNKLRKVSILKYSLLYLELKDERTGETFVIGRRTKDYIAISERINLLVERMFNL